VSWKGARVDTPHWSTLDRDDRTLARQDGPALPSGSSDEPGTLFVDQGFVMQLNLAKAVVGNETK
jgi:hypothetical protein